jgi:type I restriction enzyme S subunit
MKSYPNYKDSGIKWLGSIPENWEIIKGKHLYQILSGYAPRQVNLKSEGLCYFKVDDLNDDSSGLFLSSSTHYIEANSTYTYPAGIILFPKRGAAIFTNKVKITAVPSTFDTNLMGLKVDVSKAVVKFVVYFILSRELLDIADVSTIPQINNKHIAPLEFCLPPTAE